MPCLGVARTMLTKLSVLVFISLLCSCTLPGQSAPAQSDVYLRAENLVRNHQWDEGLAVLAPLLQQEPRNVRALNLSGLAFIGKGEVSRAEESFKKALSTDPRFVPALKNLSIIEFNSGGYTSAEKHLLAAHKIVPDDPAINLYLGEISFSRKNYPEAVDRLGKLHEYISSRPMPSAHLAISYLLTGDPAKATAILDNLALDEIDPGTRFDLAVALDHAGLHERALSEFSSLYGRFPDSYNIAFDLILEDIAVKNFPQAVQTGTYLIARGHDTAEVNGVLAQAYEGEADNQQAFEAYRRAISLDPQDEDNYIELTSFCVSQHALKTGIQVIQAGLRTFPNSAPLVYLRGIIHAIEDDYDDAEKDFNLSQTLSPSVDLGYIGLGASYLESGNSKHAIQVLRQRLREKPNDPSLLYLLGESLIRSGASPGHPDYAEAQKALEKSVSLNPNLCLPHVSLGEIYLTENRPKDAVIQLVKARTIDPKEKSIYSHLAVAYKRLGQTEDAKAVLVILKNMLDQERQSAIERMKPSSANSAEQGAEGPDNPALRH
jgi:tetratricopeptide (TPR) repeat protein